MPNEWPYIKKCLETSDPAHSRTILSNGAVAAFIIVNISETGNAFISYIGVSKDHQGKGYGSKLLKETLASIFQVDYYNAFLYVDCWNKDALRLYERIGFKIVGEAVVAGSPCHLMEIIRTSWGEKTTAPQMKIECIV